MSDGNDNNNEIETELFKHKQKDQTIQKLFFNLLDCLVFFIITHFVLLLEFSSKTVLIVSLGAERFFYNLGGYTKRFFIQALLFKRRAKITPRTPHSKHIAAQIPYKP